MDVHPYEEAQGFQQLLDMPGYDVATLVEKSGKSTAHVYARLSLLQLIPTIAEAFSAERITASHANLLARLPQDAQAHAYAYEQCWRKDWQDKEPHLLPAKHLSAWIQTNLYLSLAEAPFSKEDPTLNPPAGACVTCPRRSGFNTALFADVQSQRDQCLDASCFHTKVNAAIDREIAARPELVQIENGWRKANEQRPGAVQRGHHREIEPTTDNPEPVKACAAAKPAIIVYGKRVGTTLTVCTDNQCSVHEPRAAAEAAEAAENHAPVMDPAPEVERAEQAEERRQQFEAEQKAHQEEQQRREEDRKRRDEERQKQEEREAEFARRDKLRKKRESTFERIIAEAPPVLTAQQLRVILRALINLDPYTFADDLAAEVSEDPDNDKRSAEEVLLTAIDGTADDKLTSFAARLAFAGHRSIPRENELDFLTEAEAAFLGPKPKKNTPKKEAPAKKQAPTLVKSRKAGARGAAKKHKPQPEQNAVAA